MQTRTLAEMTEEDAGYIIRRRAVTSWEKEMNAQAVRVLVRADDDLRTIEMQAQRKLDADELAVYHATRDAGRVEKTERKRGDQLRSDLSFDQKATLRDLYRSGLPRKRTREIRRELLRQWAV